MRIRGTHRIAAVSLCALMLASGCVSSNGPGATDDRLSLTFGVGREPLSVLAYVAEHEGLFAANGLDVTFVEYDGGNKPAHEALIKGEVDVALCTDTPVVIGALSGSPVTVVATVGRNPNDIKILARKSAGIADAAGLRGKRVGVQRGTAADFFLHSYLGLQGLSDDDVEIVNGSHAEVAEALIAGGLDAATVREPQDTQVAEVLGDDLLVLDEPGLYVKTANLCFDPDRPVEPEALRRLVRTLIQAEELMAGGRSALLRETVAERIGVDPDALRPASFEPGSVSLRQALVLNFEDQALWAVSEGIVTDAGAFDALALMDPRTLDAVDAERVSIIR